MSPIKEKHVLLVDLEYSWHNIGTDIIADHAIQLLRWTHRLLREMKKSSKRKKQNSKLREKQPKKKLQKKLQQEKERKMPKKVKRNDWIIKLQYIV